MLFAIMQIWPLALLLIVSLAGWVLMGRSNRAWRKKRLKVKKAACKNRPPPTASDMAEFFLGQGPQRSLDHLVEVATQMSLQLKGIRGREADCLRKIVRRALEEASWPAALEPGSDQHTQVLKAISVVMANGERQPTRRQPGLRARV